MKIVMLILRLKQIRPKNINSFGTSSNTTSKTIGVIRITFPVELVDGVADGLADGFIDGVADGLDKELARAVVQPSRPTVRIEFELGQV